MIRKDKLMGYFSIFIVPMLALVSIVYYWFTAPLLIVVIASLGLVYAAIMSTKIDYGASLIRKVKVPGAPENIEEMLKSTTSSGDLIYVYLISVFAGEKKLSQTELVNRVKKKFEISLTHQSIRNYIIRLERAGLVQSPKVHTRERECSLTEQGLWCSDAIKVCFPRTTLWFLVRNYLEIRSLGEYPKGGSQSTLA